MTWQEYYKNCWNWADNTQYSRLSTVKDFGPESSPAAEIADCQRYLDDRTFCSLLRKALKAGVRFTSEQAAEIINRMWNCETALQEQLLLTAEGEFTAEQIGKLLNGAVDDTCAYHLLDQICSHTTHYTDQEILPLLPKIWDEPIKEKLLLSTDSKFSEEALRALFDECISEEVIRVLAKRSRVKYQRLYNQYYGLDMEPDMAEPPMQKPAKIGFFGMLLAVLGSSESHAEPTYGQCTGDCEHCPPHYGYRYGRWYYGHGHNYGCEFGGNGGCSGRCTQQD